MSRIIKNNKLEERGQINMKFKLMLLTLSIVVSFSILTGCTTKTAASELEAPKTETATAAKPDVVSGASQAPDEATFKERISKDGNFIIITSKDLTFTEDLIVDGTFEKRSLAFAAYSADGKAIENRYTVTAPSIVINSENTLLEYGIIKGDVYVQSPGFRTKDATIDGNLYFATEELKNAFSIDESSKVTGQIEVCAYTK